MNVSAVTPDKSLFRRLLSPNGSSGLASFNRNDQLIYCSLTTLAGSTLLLARWLTPSANGFGTHEQLGLPPCFFFKLTGIPCPSCGLTTSFAHSARLHFYQAFITQPFGVIAFCLTVVGIPLLLYLLRRRITWANFIRAKGVDYLIYFLIATYLLSWLYKIAAVKWLAS
ncbi:MAG: DUF2752 domain-containing protein [Acidobacteria bacterium]|nr:DUF2752 domain-containing protein [Acidobacteriota bacterium]